MEKKMIFINYCPDDQWTGCSILNAHAELAYRRIQDLIYINDDKLLDEDVTWEQITRGFVSEAEKIKQELLKKEKITISDDYIRNKRCTLEIEKAKSRHDNAKKGAESRWAYASHDASHMLTTNQEPLTTNHKLIKEPTATRGARLPADWKPNAELVAWSKAERPDLELRKVFEEFKDYWSSLPGSKGVKLDWDATWRNWVRKQTAAKASFAQQASDVVRSTVPYSQDAALRKVEDDHKTGAPPPAHIREMMRGILGVKNA